MNIVFYWTQIPYTLLVNDSIEFDYNSCQYPNTSIPIDTTVIANSYIGKTLRIHAVFQQTLKYIKKSYTLGRFLYIRKFTYEISVLSNIHTHSYLCVAP